MRAFIVKPLIKGHFGTRSFVPSLKVIPISKVHRTLILYHRTMTLQLVNIKCAYNHYGPKSYIDKMKELVNSLIASGLV